VAFVISKRSFEGTPEVIRAVSLEFVPVAFVISKRSFEGTPKVILMG